ncbi:hypothetical protein AB6A40_005164 [Gnathostoma spinigerum]|uniref:C2 domain-containing protein n=1 Tax=Gnathostoma spinigerum TaxID=75299 RepID=A0ABD6EEM9_9BILA
MHEMSDHLTPPSSSTLLEPCRRRLPATPGSRRSSSPRILPSPPPISPEYLPSSSALERRPSGRKLPIPPVVANVTDDEWPPSSPQRKFSVMTDTSCIPHPEDIQYFNRQQQESEALSRSIQYLMTEGRMSPCSPPFRLSSTPSSNHGSGTSLGPSSSMSPPIATAIPELEVYSEPSPGGTPSSTNAPSQSSSLSPSIDQLASKSNSDAEDAAAIFGIDPSLYQPISATTSNFPTSASDSTPPSTAITTNLGSATATTIGLPPPSNTVKTSSSWPESEPRPAGLGLVHFSVQFFPVRKRLRISLLKAEGLAGQLKPELEIHPFCKIALHPGPKGQSSSVKRGRSVVFNEEFFFDGVSVEELDEKSVCITVYHQSSQKLQKDAVIGDVIVPLKSFAILKQKKEVRIIEELKRHLNVKKLGKLHITSCIEKEARRLTINIIKADDLPKGGITGPPDVCVRIQLTQGAKTQTKQSRILKNTCSAVYKEAIMFLINTQPSELQETSITISIHDMARVSTGDDIIGCVYLGKNAIDKSEIDQWRNTSQHKGKEFKGVHSLKVPPTHATNAHAVGAGVHSDSD